ncbi:hypothetical protein TRFO_10087 [Tritrichomonas foetus]|uniref:CWH43-like N-terminal domain-containing protein n=1 Tax=Tritrichomonas foetus TaxID=1144522 RepID=A0A1J4JAG5_9EUKA|nr:hypothetical protein TRFO_10087 [Tritrichomonas foetus]|eukprot:OHS96174.1 hypothetical protein TRFO_10087 [Tritrichomonas foetus]
MNRIFEKYKRLLPIQLFQRSRYIGHFTFKKTINISPLFGGYLSIVKKVLIVIWPIMGFDYRSIFSSPQNVFWFTAILPGLSIIVSFVTGLIQDQYSLSDFPLGSVVIGQIPERYIFGTTAAVVFCLICSCTYHLYQFFTRGARAVRNNTVTKALTYVLILLGFLAALGYGAIAFFTIHEGFSLHFQIEFAAFVALFAFYGVADYLFVFHRYPLSKQMIAYYCVVGALFLTYFVSLFLLLKKNQSDLVKVISATGYLLFLTAYAKFPFLAKEFLGIKFYKAKKN